MEKTAQPSLASFPSTDLSDYEDDYVVQTQQWKKDFEDSLPSKLDNLAETIAVWLMNSLGFAVAPSSILVRKVIEKWSKKEFLGVED